MENCKTKYPILLVHGMGFRDGRICYWGRIPAVLGKHGAEVYFGGQEANATVERNAALLAERLSAVLEKTGAEKVNIIAHSKGGIEARYLISALGAGGRVASLTTVCTPHNGSRTMDKLMKLRPLMRLIGTVTDVFMRIGGDKKPDTYRCFEQLTKDYMRRFNAENPDDSRVFYRSCGFLMRHWFSDVILTVPYIGVKLLNGKSDGFLTPDEVTHGSNRGIFTGKNVVGVSHCGATDLWRFGYRIKRTGSDEGFRDITELYVKLVSELKEAGL